MIAGWESDIMYRNLPFSDMSPQTGFGTFPKAQITVSEVLGQQRHSSYEARAKGSYLQTTEVKIRSCGKNNLKTKITKNPLARKQFPRKTTLQMTLFFLEIT